METAFVGASAGAVLAFALLSAARRRSERLQARQLEAELFARRLRRSSGDPPSGREDSYPAGERA
jgi:hypothetical protein